MYLGVNIDHVATVRQARGTDYPAPSRAVPIAEAAGADSITVHLREDRRHIQDSDLDEIMAVLTTRLNLEMALTEEMLAIAERVKPVDVCIVPERRQEVTTEGGLDVRRNFEAVKAGCERLAQSGIRVSLFIDPDHDQVNAAKDAGAPVIELHTGAYAEANAEERGRRLLAIRQATELGKGLGLRVNAGHGLNYENVAPICAMPGIYELNIGHSIIAESVYVGLEQAVRRMRQAMGLARK